MDISKLIGARSNVASTFRVVNKVDTSNSLARKHGVGPLGVHMQINLALDEEFGRPEWRKWVTNIWDGCGVLYSNNHKPVYTQDELAYWLVYGMYTHLALCELRRDIKMLRWTISDDTSARRDFWGTSWESAREMSGAEYNDIVDLYNRYIKDFYTQFPFINLNYISFVSELLSSVWRDDKEGRTNYIYFHLFDNYYDKSDPITSCQKPLYRAFKRIECWITGKDSETGVSGYGVYRLSEDSRTRIKNDLRMVFPDSMHTVPTMSRDEEINVDYSEQLIRALNQSPLGIPELVDMESMTANNVGGVLFDLFGAGTGASQARTWSNPVQTFVRGSEDTESPLYNVGVFSQTFDANNRGDALTLGPSIYSWFEGRWDGVINTHFVSTFDRAMGIINSHKIPLTAYASFDNGADVLGDFSFTPVPGFVTFDSSSGSDIKDPEPTLNHTKGYIATTVFGLFGFCVSRVWSYDYSAFAVESAVPQMTYAIPSSYIVYGSSVTIPTMGINIWPAARQLGMSRYKEGVGNSMALANSIDAITTYQWQSTSSGNVAIVSDEDIDEWGPTSLEQLIAAYAATAQGMFIEDYIVPTSSNRVTSASSSDNYAGVRRNDRRNQDFNSNHSSSSHRDNYDKKRGGRNGKNKR